MGHVSRSALGRSSSNRGARSRRWLAAPRVLSLAVGLLLLAAGCGSPARRPAAPPSPTPDPRVSLSEPTVAPRPGAEGAPVDCSTEVSNRSGRILSRLVLACELLDADGVPIGTGLGALQNVANGQRRAVRTVVYGVRNFASARAVITSLEFQ